MDISTVPWRNGVPTRYEIEKGAVEIAATAPVVRPPPERSTGGWCNVPPEQSDRCFSYGRRRRTSGRHQPRPAVGAPSWPA